MNRDRWKKISLILDVALSYPGEKRTTFINDVCNNDPDLIREVNELLETLSEPDDESFFEHPEENDQLIHSVLHENSEPESDVYKNGTAVDRWVLSDLIGKGGMGSVYKAERIGDGEVHQTVALKIIHKSLVTPSHLDRFKLEQQILSGLEHPNIARFIDSGVTSDGVPYMVMERVEGDPILDYCDKHRLGINQRIEIFKTVCRTIQYAHKSLVVHRDLKSENILVTPESRVKILDFGIAKLLDPNVYDYSIIETQPGTRLLSLEYASPEQIKGGPVKTSSDIYSLGILLYKLLVGIHPFDVDEHSYREVEELVLEKDPPMPSKRFTNCADDKMKVLIAGGRREEPAGLIKKVSGDLDAIVQKTLRKDPERRYISVEALIVDLERHQKARPIFARPDSYGYRFRKFSYRRRWAITTVLVVMLVLISGITATLWQANEAEVNARRAELQAQRAVQVTDFLVELFESGDPEVARGNEISIAGLLAAGIDKARDPNLDSRLQINMLSTLGRVYLSLGEYPTSIDLLEEALQLADSEQDAELALLTADIQTYLGLNFRFTGNLAIADSLLQKAFENRRAMLGENHPETISSMDDWAAVKIYRSHDLELADSLFTDILERRQRVLGDDDEDLAESLNNLGYIKTRKGEFAKALSLYEEASGIYNNLFDDHHPKSMSVMSSIAFLYHKLGDFGRSESIRRETIEIRRKVLGEKHPHLAMSYHYLAELLRDAGRTGEALENSRVAVKIMQDAGTTLPAYPDALILLATIYHDLNDRLSAAETYRSASAACIAQRGINAPVCYRLNLTIGEFFMEEDEYTEAYAYLQQSYDAMRLILEPGHPQLIKVRELLSRS